MQLASDLVGEMLAGRYRLTGRAPGGSGDVYLGHDERLDRPVSVRVLQLRSPDQEVLRDRFRAEAAAAARLAHPSIVTIYDWGCEQDGTCYAVTEYFPGIDLRDLLVSRGTLDYLHAVEIMLPLCEALSAAHSSGLTHGGVSPEVVLISRFGPVKVTHFGVAAVAANGGDVAGAAGAGRYLPPESGRGEPTSSGDIWAAGAVLCEMLTGHPPPAHGGMRFPGRWGRHVPVSGSPLSRRAPVELAAVVAVACAPAPGDRYPTASDMADAVRRAGARVRRRSPPVGTLLEDVTGDRQLELSRRAAQRTTGPSRSRVRLARLAAAGLVALVLFGAARGVVGVMAPDPVPVPDVVGAGRDTAERRAERVGLEVVVVDTRHHKRIPEGRIVSQRQRGTLTEGATMGVVVSRGPPFKGVPVLTGLTVDGARDRLAEVGMSPGGVTERYSTQPDGTVIAQSPSDGKLLWGSRVDLVVSRGPAPVEVPDVTGMTTGEAERTLRRSQLVPTMVSAFSTAVPEGEVIETAPGPGDFAAFEGEVEVYFSRGPRFEELDMPDVRGTGARAARERLERLGLRVRVLPSCGPGGVVVDTDPVAGAVVRENDLVALFVC
jgi:eukaryotic-like serine/threonine-protein kinase